MHKKDLIYDNCFKEAEDLFDKRMFQYLNSGLFIHDYSKKQANILHKNAEKKIMDLKKYLL